MGVWDFIQNQILGMKWLNGLIGSLLTSFGLDVSSRWGGSAQFFLYDVIKITRRAVPSGTYLSSSAHGQLQKFPC